MPGTKDKMAQKRILLIDDDGDFLEELRELLILSGYNAIAVNDGMEALRIARELRPDLILVDIKMKGINGFQVADRFNQSFDTSHIPIVAMSGHFNNGEHTRLINMLGIKALIKKPFRPLDIITHIEKYAIDD